jgi:hypothetical protein
MIGMDGFGLRGWSQSAVVNIGEPVDSGSVLTSLRTARPRTTAKITLECRVDKLEFSSADVILLTHIKATITGGRERQLLSSTSRTGNRLTVWQNVRETLEKLRTFEGGEIGCWMGEVPSDVRPAIKA